MTVYRLNNIAGNKKYEPVSFIKRGVTLTRCILVLAKSYRGKPVSPVDVKRMFPTLCRKPSDAKAIMRRLEGRKMLRRVDQESWCITKLGVKAVYLLGSRDVENHGGIFTYETI